mmetsp:Transcript_38868/g.74590  ORF Transcript_38868/g.74590 Transcript_38868/m.74590 type:complete len:154 (+) Transcript_38868:55-516(+)
MMAMKNRSLLLPCILALAACACFIAGSLVAFVPPLRQDQPASLRVATRAMPQPKEGDRQIQEESGGALPKPDLRILNTAARRGTSYDQDKKGNQWTVEAPVRRKTTEEPLKAEVFIPVVFVLTFAAIAYFAVLTGNDPRFGGEIGDGSLKAGD